MTRHVDPAELGDDAERLRMQSVERWRMTRRSEALLAAAGMSLDDVRWYVLSVSVGHEKAVEKALAEAGVPHWLPTCKIKSGRRRGAGSGPRPERIVVAFPGYVLVRIAWCPQHWAAIRTVEGVRGLLSSGGLPCAVPDAMVLKLQQDLKHDDKLKAKVAGALEAGDSVVVNDGPFAGWLARLTSLDENRGVVELDILGRVTPVDMDLASLKRLG